MKEQGKELAKEKWSVKQETQNTSTPLKPRKRMLKTMPMHLRDKEK